MNPMYTYSIAESKSQIESVITLVTRVYAKSGYVDSDSSLQGITKFLYDATRTVSIMASKGDLCVGTISVVIDGEGGLPMDSLYEHELQPLRQQERKIAEVCQFAIDKDSLKGGETKITVFSENDLALQLFGLVLSYCEKKHIEFVVFAVNPKHKSFYEVIGARQIGGEKLYQSVRNAPALAYVLEVSLLKGGVGGLFIGRVIRQMTKVADELFIR